MIVFRCFKVCNNVFFTQVYLLCTTSFVWVQVQGDVHALSAEVSLHYMHM
jgi:hypothetical protein